jgi:DNA polymerase-4
MVIGWLFVDLNAYFASVEQQENPRLRGKPVGIVPVMTDTTCCIAASYEAKAFGIQTGTRVWEAKRLCPQIQLVEARQHVYVSYHHAIIQAVESCIPVDRVLSIDEMICRLSGSQQNIDRAIELASKIKRTLTTRVGAYLKCSIGIAPNRYLAKVASDMKKPDGLTVIRSQDLPDVLYPLSLRDLSGVGEQMEGRLRAAGVTTVRHLCQLSTGDMRDIWGGVPGERFWCWLRGNDTPDPPHHRYSIGHSHVLEPEARQAEGVYQVAKKMTSKAAVRLRKETFWATGLTLSIKYMEDLSWEGTARFGEAQDTPTFLKALDDLWKEVPHHKPLWVGITLHPLIPTRLHNPSLFENPRQEKLSHVMDTINDHYGKNTAYFASLSDSLQKAPTRISFTRIPDLSEF